MTPAPAQTAFSGRRIDAVRACRTYWKLSVCAAAFILAAGIPVVLLKGKLVYYTEASLYVSPRFIKNLEGDKEFEMQSNSQYREFVQQHVRTINRFDIVSDALGRLGPLRSTFQEANESDRRAAERLQGALEIRPVPDTYQITVGLSGKSPAGLAELVNAVASAYLEKDRGERFFDVDTTLANLSSERTRLMNEIASREATRIEISQELGVATFNDSYLNPYDQLVAGSKSALAAASQRRFEAEAQFNVVDPTRSAESKEVLASMAADLTSKDASITSLYANLNVRRSELLTRTSGMAESHPGRKAALRELQEIDEIAKRTQVQLTDSHAREIIEQRRSELQRARQVEQNLASQVKEQLSEASQFSESYLRALSIGGDLERLRKRLDSVEDRLSYIHLELKAPGFVRIFSKARTPEIPVRGGKKKLALLFACAATAIGLIVPLALDFLDPRVRTFDELGRILGFAPLGWLAERTPPTTELYADQVRRLSAGILRDTETQGSRTFAFTAAAPGSGTTELLIAVANELKRLGVNALIVEANAVHPTPSFRPSGRTAAGFAGVLRGVSAISDEIVPGSGEHPDVVPIGAEYSGRLQGLAGIRAVLNTVPDRYRIVLLDVAPLSTSADSELIARGADVAVLVVRAEAETSGEIRRALRTLESARPKAAGAVINRVRPYRLAAAGGSRNEPEGKKTGSRLLSPWLWT